ncbi:lactonase family protein [Roseisolibacter sp. H3M3-2]|uniref:lactonase family protein n=1 Tax=Roseisolibacter sp. H3M3-2 TaxID=3031323 RepID=UPI0023DCCF8F|nr:lactonase family protein [Roseisolibacter sp. H3M3-2]MDF1503860.1 lactonase family protein [Roseisolibacter sp. H3M3-2]
MDRRTFLAAGTTGLLAGCARRAASPSRDGALVFVGTYTENTRSAGVYAFRADAATGRWTALGATAVGPNPSYLALHPNGRVLYAVNEVTRLDGAATGAVRAFAVDRATGALAPLGYAAPTGGGAPCYASVDPSGRLLMVANYVGGSVAAFPLAADGRIAGPRFLDQHAGRGARADRQDAPHAHCVIPAPGGRWAVSTDLGLDRVTVHALDAAAGTLAPAGGAAAGAGAGPRHLAFHPSGRTLYVVNELDLTLAALPFDPATGALSADGVVLPLLATPAPAGSTAADLHLHPSGRALYASVRGDDSIARFALDAAGRPTWADRTPSGGRRPRNFALDPAGRFLHAANQGSDAIVTFAVGADGRLSATGETVEVPAPVCVIFG